MPARGLQAVDQFVSALGPPRNSSVTCRSRSGRRAHNQDSQTASVFLWGLDLFNHGYYWEAHEAWEGLWQAADRDGPPRMLFRGLILLSAAGVKIRDRKHAATARHAKRAAALRRQLMKVPDRALERAVGMSPVALVECTEVPTRLPADLQATAPGQPQPVFNFILGPNSRGRPSGSQKRNGHEIRDTPPRCHAMAISSNPLGSTTSIVSGT